MSTSSGAGEGDHRRTANLAASALLGALLWNPRCREDVRGTPALPAVRALEELGQPGTRGHRGDVSTRPCWASIELHRHGLV